MSWHYQVRKYTSGKETWYDIVEVYTSPRGWTRKGIKPMGESREEVIRCLEMMLYDAKKYKTLVDKA